MENNTKQIALSMEQMKYLKELGCDTSSASMCYYLTGGYRSLSQTVKLDLMSNNNSIAIKKIIPTFSLQDILELLEKTKYESTWFPMIMLDYNIMNGFWCISLRNTHGFEALSFKERSVLDVAYKMLCWLLENKYKKFNNKNKQ